jgi:hypothetical protein
MSIRFTPAWLLLAEPFRPALELDDSPELWEAYERGVAGKRRRRGWSALQREAWDAGRRPVVAPAPWRTDLFVTAVETLLSALPEKTLQPKAPEGSEESNSLGPVAQLQITTLAPVAVAMGARLLRRRAQRRRAEQLGLTGATAPRTQREIPRTIVNGAFVALVNKRADKLGPPWARKLALSLAADLLLRSSWRRSLRVPTENAAIIGGDDEQGVTRTAARRGLRRRSPVDA